MFATLFENDELLVVDKSSGVSVLADRTGAPCLWDELKARYRRPRLAHRIDKGTSGVLLVALTADCQRALTRAFNRRLIRKHYLAVVAGHVPTGATLTVSLPLKRGRKNRYRVAGLREEIRSTRRGWHIESADGLASTTRIRALRRTARRSLIVAQPVTGRSHQLRVHLSWIGHAVVGDHLYGAPSSPEQSARRLALHAHRLAVPGYGVFTAPPSQGFWALLA